MLEQSFKISIKFFNKFYKYIFFLLFILLLIIYYSPNIGLGSKNTFYFYKLFGIYRSTIFLYVLYSIFICLVLLFGIKHLSISNSHLISNKNTRELSLNICIFLIFLISCTNYLSDGYRFQFNAFKWTAFSNFPGLVNSIYNGVLQYDFFTNTIINTPRIIIIKLLQLPSKIGIHWYDGVYLYHVIIGIIYMPLLFICFNNIINKFCINKKDSLSKILFFHFLIFILIWSKIIESLQPYTQSLIGWPSAFPTIGVETDNLSLIVGLFYLQIRFNNKYKSKQILSILLLGLCTMIHILYGLAIFSIMLLYYFSYKRIHYNHSILLEFLIGILLPVTILISIYDNPSPLSAKNFIEIYNLTTHSMHYKISELLGWGFINWIFLYLCQLIICIKIKEQKLIKLSLLSLCFFILPTLFQFVGTEIWKIKIIGILGLNRFSGFNTFIFCINTLIIIGRSNIINKIEILIKKFIFLIKSRKILYNSKNEIMIYNNIKYFTFHFFNNTKLIYITIFILLSTIWGFTKHNPLHNQISSSDSIMHYKRYESLPLLCDWMKNHLPKNAVLFINDKNNNNTNVSLSFAIKCFGHRATFTDYVFPFNESSLLEWGTRLDYYKNFDKLTINKFLKISKDYSITHLLIANYTNDKFANYPYIWKSKDFILYDIDQFH